MNILKVDLDHGTIIAPSGSEIWCDFGMMKGEAYRDDFPLGHSRGASGEGLQVFHLPGAWMMITKVIRLALHCTAVRLRET